jgi:hypothetical protein
VRLNRIVLVAALLAPAVPAGAQTVITPEAKLDSTQVVIFDALYRLRDSLQMVDAASASIARDRNQTSDAVLGSRARTMSERCRAAVRAADDVEDVVQRSDRPEPDPKGDRPRYLRALEQLRTEMQKCEEEFARLSRPESAQELRDYGIGRGHKVQQGIRGYEPEITRYFHAATGRRYAPYLKGAGATPTGS